jgi:osmotically-inducible protein OsmY
VDISGDVRDDAEARVLAILAHAVPGVTQVELH